MSVIETDTADVQVSASGATSHVNGYKIMQLLGEGSFSKVYQCQDSDGKEFALKILNKSFLKRKREYKRVDGKMVLSNAFQKVQREVAIMKKLSHPNLVKLHEVIDSPADDKLFLVLELIRGGQIMTWDDKNFRYKVRDTSTGVLDKAAVRECLRDVVAALDYLHRNHICHRDIKPENILLSATGYKLADFGVAHMREEDSTTIEATSSSGVASSVRLRSTEGTYHFLAPECTTGDDFDPYQVDVWAVGVTMFVLLVGTLPFGTNVESLSGVMDSIRDDPLVLPDHLDPECAELITQLMEKNPRWRITLSQLKKHPWLVGYPGSDIADAVAAAQAQRSTPIGGLEVQVTQQEIEAAFTPINNFILMTKLKVKMSSRLSRARKALAASDEPRVEKVPVTQHVSVSPTRSGLSSGGDGNGKEEEDPKACEMAPSELSSPSRPQKLQKRPSRIMESFSETIETLNTTLTRRKSQMGAAATTSAFLSPEAGKSRISSSTALLTDDEVAETAGEANKPAAASRSRMLPRRLSRRDTASNGALAPAAVAAVPLASSPETAEDGHDDEDTTVKMTKREPSPSKSDVGLTGSTPSSPVGTTSGSSPLKPKLTVSPTREMQLQPLRTSKLPALELDALTPVTSPRVTADEAYQEPLDSPRSKTALASAGSPKSSVRVRNLSAIKASSSIPGFVVRDDEVALPTNGADSVGTAPISSADALQPGNKTQMSPLRLTESIAEEGATVVTSPRSGQSPRRSSSPYKPIRDLDRQRPPPSSPRPVTPRNLSLDSAREEHGSLAAFVRSSSLAKALDQCFTPEQKTAMRKFKADEMADEKAASAAAEDTKATVVAPLTASASPTKRNVVHVPPIGQTGAKVESQAPAPREEKKPSRVLAAFDRAVSQTPKSPAIAESPSTDVASSSPGKSPMQSMEQAASRRRSILEAQDSLRVLMRRKSSVKLIMTDARATYAPSGDQAAAPKPKTGVCAVM